MLNTLGPPVYQDWVVTASRAVESLDLAALRGAGITHIYVGAVGNFDGPGLDRAQLAVMPGVWTVYESPQVAIFALAPAE